MLFVKNLLLIINIFEYWLSSFVMYVLKVMLIIGSTVGMMMPDLSNGAARNDEAASRSAAMTSSPRQLSSSVEVHRASGSDSDNESIELPVNSPQAAQHQFSSQRHGIENIASTARRNSASEIDIVESLSVMEPTVDVGLELDRTGSIIV